MDWQESKYVGEKLKERRKSKGIKQNDLAKKLKVSLSYISKIESGRIPLYLLLFIEYCKAIDVSPIDLMSSIGDLFL